MATPTPKRTCLVCQQQKRLEVPVLWSCGDSCVCLDHREPCDGEVANMIVEYIESTPHESVNQLGQLFMDRHHLTARQFCDGLRYGKANGLFVLKVTSVS